MKFRIDTFTIPQYNNHDMSIESELAKLTAAIEANTEAILATGREVCAPEAAAKPESETPKKGRPKKEKAEEPAPEPEAEQEAAPAEMEPEEPKAETAAEKDLPDGWADKDAKARTAAVVELVRGKWSERKGADLDAAKAKTREILDRFGEEKVNEVPPDKLVDFYNAINAEL